MCEGGDCMDKKEAYKIVYDDLIRIPTFGGLWNAKNDDANSYYTKIGIYFVMSTIAFAIDPDNKTVYNEYEEIFKKNLKAQRKDKDE